MHHQTAPHLELLAAQMAMVTVHPRPLVGRRLVQQLLVHVEDGLVGEGETADIAADVVVIVCGGRWRFLVRGLLFAGDLIDALVDLVVHLLLRVIGRLYLDHMTEQMYC